MPELEVTYTIDQVALRYHRTVDTVRRWVRSGRMTAINTGGGRIGPYVFRREDIDRFDAAAEHCGTGGEEPQS